jgi:hypothetical protein
VGVKLEEVFEEIGLTKTGYEVFGGLLYKRAKWPEIPCPQDRSSQRLTDLAKPPRLVKTFAPYGGGEAALHCCRITLRQRWTLWRQVPSMPCCGR